MKAITKLPRLGRSLSAGMLCLIWIAFPLLLQAQGALANPSFEVIGSGGAFFGGWNQFGNTGSSDQAYHGFNAAQLSGLDNGNENVAGFWQQLDCDVGERWHITGNVMIASNAPLTGECVALLNIEWRNANGALSTYDSHIVADSASALGEYIPFDLLSAAAPAGAVAMRLVVGLIQRVGATSPVVLFDQITCYSTSIPTMDDMQWDDFPDGRVVEFSNRSWRVKGTGFYGPGPNNFSHLPQSIWVDAEDRLHLTIKQIGGTWYSTEVALEEALGYGDYIFTTLGALNLLDLRTVLGLFIWQYGPTWDPGMSWWNPYNEIDVEYSRWGNPSNQIGQFVVQPWDWAGNITRYDAVFGADQLSSHAFKWLPDRVEFRSWYGGPEDETATSLISTWNYYGPHIPRPEQPRVHMNLWYFGSPPSTNQEAIISDFTFVPAGGNTANEDHLPAANPTLLAQNYPNPFNHRTSIHFTLAKPGKVLLSVYDIRGRKLATLVDESKAAGDHIFEWDAGNLASGIYFYRILSGGKSSTRKMILLK
ncbi:MAG: T9SS type A sorting domain-containing protein [Candidatus Cloacimonadaceae bacterium]|nr:T9SS type A sorting domain-containing protein [Candidatus Cloacimonadaceae bacterium]